MGQIMSILVEYKFVDGWHVFSSDEMHGLYIANKNAELAFNDVPTAIEKLMKLNSDIDCKVTAELSYFEFVRRCRAAAQEQVAREVEDEPIALETQRYAVCPTERMYA